MRARRRRANGADYLSDALALLSGWTRDGVQLKRELACDESQHAALTERIKVAADTLHLRPSIRRLARRAGSECDRRVDECWVECAVCRPPP